MKYEYNTNKPHLTLKEYGRNIQQLAEHISTMDDREERSRYAKAMIALMVRLNPNIKDPNESAQKMWDDLHIMSDFQLEIDSPYPMPDRDILYRKPERLQYSRDNARFKHYGKNVEKMIRNALEVEDEVQQKAALVQAGRLMKGFYMTWNKENVDDEIIIKNINELAGEKVNLTVEEVKENNFFDVQVNTSNNSNSRSRSGGSNNGGKRRKKKRN